ncbi:hypothetical protein [Micromonospora coerulea]|uniref:hypothetical protein n=1 Tax=Micromonospora coerulea TaxID=47856 RepID=UPI0027DB20FC|nr:hypothetical protein [Micromonospora veneta]
MTTPRSWLRPAALAAPVLLFGYGILRLLDGRDGYRDKSGWPWRVGHILFLLGIVLFAVLMVELRRLLLATSPRLRVLTDVATVAGLVGAAAFVWVILGDIFPGFADAVPPPDPVLAGGPALFQLGLLTLLVRAVAVRLLPAWGPVLVLVGFVAIAVDLDLLPLGAALVFAGLLPIRRSVG